MVNMEDGSKSEVLYDRIIGITKMNGCCLIYLNAASFFCMYHFLLLPQKQTQIHLKIGWEN